MLLNKYIAIISSLSFIYCDTPNLNVQMCKNTAVRQLITAWISYMLTESMTINVKVVQK